MRNVFMAVLQVILCYVVFPQSFDLKQSKLPPGFKGNSVDYIYQVVDKNVMKKDEFETTREYEERVKKAKAESGIYDSVFAFPVICSRKGLEFTYDPDRGVEKIDILVKSGCTGSQGAAFLSTHEIINSSKSTGQNAYGATVEIDQTIQKQCLVNIDNYEIIRKTQNENIDFGSLFVSIKLKEPPEVAREMRKNIKVVFVCKLTGTCSRNDSTKATISNPYEVFTKIIIVKANLISVITYNEVNGEILFRYDL